MLENIRLATRKSPLALKQAHIVKDYLLQKGLFKSIDDLPMSTSGDTVDSKVFKNHGGKGLFLKELENALINGEADIAVHSMKDVPAIVTPMDVATITKYIGNDFDNADKASGEIFPAKKVSTILYKV